MNETANFINMLRKDLEETNKTDDITNGTVIRFTWRGIYTYAVIKSGDKFYSTATRDGVVPMVMDYEKLVEVLSYDSVDNINVAVAFKNL